MKPREPIRQEALTVFVVTAVLLVVFRSDTDYGDGILYLWRAKQEIYYVHHHLYMPVMIAFAKLLTTLGVPHRLACHVHQAVMVALGNALLYLMVRRRLAVGKAFGLVALVATTPVLVFYATTIENHAQHYGFVCLALWLLERAKDRASVASFALAGLGLACVPSSHLTGFLLLPALVLSVVIAGERRPTAWVVFLVPVAIYTLLFHVPPVARWFKGEVLAVDPSYLADPIRFQIEAEIVGNPLPLARWPMFLLWTWFLPAFGVWTLFVVMLRSLLSARSRLLLLGVALVCYVVPITLQGIPERGAYFIALLPFVAVELGKQLSRRRLPHARLLMFGLASAQLVAASVALAQYPASKQYPPQQRWADDAAIQIHAETEAGSSKRAVVLCRDIWRENHLLYDHDIIAVALFQIPHHKADRDRILAGWATQLPAYAANQLYMSQKLWDSLPERWPAFRKLLETSYAIEPVVCGSFQAVRIRPR